MVLLSFLVIYGLIGFSFFFSVAIFLIILLSGPSRIPCSWVKEVLQDGRPRQGDIRPIRERHRSDCSCRRQHGRSLLRPHDARGTYVVTCGEQGYFCWTLSSWLRLLMQEHVVAVRSVVESPTERHPDLFGNGDRRRLAWAILVRWSGTVGVSGSLFHLHYLFS